MKLVSSIYLVNFAILFNFIFCQASKGQVIPDSSLPNNSAVTSSGQDIQIEGGTTRGAHLFHSFEEFSVPVDRTASFNNSADVQNIFSRVTGNSISEIDGALLTNGTASLFLINPNGIIFGDNASLNIGGSFLATTAESLIFDDGTQFETTRIQTTPLLTITAPVGLSLGTNPGQIVNRAGVLNSTNESEIGLQVQSGNTLSLLGGEIVLDGGLLTANGGRIELGAVADENIVSLRSDDRGWQLNYEAVNDFQDINLSQSAISSDGDVSGNINIQGKNVTLTETSQISLTTSDSQAGSLIVKSSESIILNGADSRLFNEVEATASGETGILNIETKQLSILNGAIVSSATFGTGSGVNTQINASESILIEGADATASPPSVSLISTRSRSRSSNEPETFNLEVPNIVTGDAGNLILKTKELTIKDGGQISASTFTQGNAGNLTITVSNSILLQGRNLEIDIPSSIFAQVGAEATGNGGSINIETSQLTVLDGAQISTATRSNGQGGNIDIDVTDSIVLSGTSSINDVETSRSNITASGRAEASGDSGNLELNTELLIVENGAALSVNNLGTGEAGNININARNVTLDRGNITAETREGDEGNINIDNADTLLLRNSRDAAIV